MGGRRKERGKGTGRGVVEKESDREGDVAVGGGGRRKERRKEERAEREEGRSETLLNATLSPRE